MDLKSACELILRVEQETDVNAILYEDAHLWPLIRQQLWVTSIQQENGSAGAESQRVEEGEQLEKPAFSDHLTHLFKRWRKMIKHTRRQAGVATSFSKPEKAIDICFLSQPIYYSERLRGKPYSRIIDPLYELFSSHNNCLKLEDIGAGRTIPERAYPVHPFSPDLPLQYGAKKDLRETVITFSDLLHDICGIAGIEPDVLITRLVEDLALAVRYRETYAGLLEKLKPRLVFLASYYFPQFMALNWAAQQRSVPVVDVQHGKQGKFQAMYSHWTVIPDSGYCMLPTWFWSWGKQSTDNIMKWQETRRVHRCVIGGYPWLSRWRDNDFSKVKVPRPDAKKVILITTQAPVGGIGDFFPDMLVNTIRESSSDWFWIIREHPNYPQGRAQISKKLDGVENSRYSLGGYNEMPLYSLLSICDFHITAYSSVCYEAEALSVPTAVFSTIAKELYDTDIKCGRFAFCSNVTDLLASISSFRVKHDREQYIESSTELACSALKAIAQSSNMDLFLK